MNALSVRNSLLCAALTACGCLTIANAKTVTLAMDVELDQVAPEDAKMYRVGGHNLDRIAYDDTKIDPVTRKVKIIYMAHYVGGAWHPTEPTETSTLDLSSKPYKLDFTAAVNHGRPLVVLFEGPTQRMAMLTRPDFRMLIAGKYTIDPTPLSPAQIAAPPPKAHDPDTMPILSGMPSMPGPGMGPRSPAASSAPLSTSSTYGELLDNPASKAVLLELIPEVVNNPQSAMGRGMPLKDLAQFEPTLTQDKLRQVDEALHK